MKTKLAEDSETLDGKAVASAPACSAWLREQGAVSPMSACGVVHLVLGRFQQTEGKETGTYPVSYYKPMFGGRRGGEETWYHYHEKLDDAPTRQQCLDWVSEQNADVMAPGSAVPDSESTNQDGR